MSTAKWAALAGVAFAGWQIKQAIEFNATLEQTNMGLTVMYRSAARAAIQMDRLLAFSARTPFRFAEIAETSRHMEAFGLDTNYWMQTVGDTAAAVNRSIYDVSHALGYLSTGRSGEAVESLARMGIALRNMPNLKFAPTTGQMITPPAEALEIIKAELDRRYGGMMKRQAYTFTGAKSTLLDNIAITRGQMIEKLFTGIRDRMVEINARWKEMTESPRVARMIAGIQNGLGRALEYGDKLARTFTSAFDKGGSLGDGLKAVLKSVWSDAKPYAEQFIAWLAATLAQAFKVALKAVWESDPSAKLALGGMGALMLAPTAMRLVSAAPAIGRVGAGALGLGAAGGGALLRGAGGLIGHAGTKLPMALETATGGFSYAAPGTGAGLLGGLSGMGGIGMILAKAIPPVAIAAAVAWVAGKIGQYFITKASANQIRNLEDQRAWIGLETRLVQGQKTEYRERKTFEVQNQLRNVLQGAAAAWSELLDIQEKMVNAFHKVSETLAEIAASGLERMMTDADTAGVLSSQATAAGRQRADAAAKMRQADMELEFGIISPVEAAKKRADAQGEYIRALEEETRLKDKLLAMDEQANAKMRDANKEFAKRLGRMSDLDRGEALAIRKFLGSAEGADFNAKFGALSGKEQRLVSDMPDIQERAGKFLEDRARAAGVEAPFKNVPTYEEDLARRNRVMARQQDLRGPAAAYPESEMAAKRSRIEEDAAKKALEFKVKITADEIHLVISKDDTADAAKTVQKVLDDHAAEMSKVVEEAIRGMAPLMAMIARRQSDRLRAEAINGERTTPN